jgi:SAM-dependent methyltransferase
VPVNSRRVDAEDFEFLLASGRAASRMAGANFLHLDQPVGVWNYIRIANEMAARYKSGRVLDWGCGYGQMSYLLSRRGFTVTSFDVGADVQHPSVPLTQSVKIQRSAHPTALPFPDGSFDVVLSCGVLEHVDEYSERGNERKSLAEIRRVLAPRGWFAIYQLPQLWAWQEAVTRTLGVGYSHPRRFTEAAARELLSSAGFAVEDVRRNNLLPKNLTGLPPAVRNVYGRLGRALIGLDSVLSRIPVLNRLAGVLEITARRT